MIETCCIDHEAEGDADTDELGLALGVDDGEADPELDGLLDTELEGDCELLGLALTELLGEADGLRDGEDDGDRLALGLELVSGSSAFGRILRETSSSWVTNLEVATSRSTQS